MVINYKDLNDDLMPSRYPFPTIEALFIKHANFNVFMIGIEPKDKYKTGFVVTYGHLQCKLMPFKLKNTTS